MMPSRQQSPTSSTTSNSSTKKAGHQRNPMACTNCRARKIKCDSNKRYPDNPCVRCVARKLTCEYVAIAHTPSSDTRSRSGSFSSYPSSTLHDSNGKSHPPTNPSARYSPLSSSLHSRSSRSEHYPLDTSHYSSSNSSYSDSPRLENNVSSSYYGTYNSPAANFGDPMALPGLNQVPHYPSNYRSSTPQYDGYASGMPGVLPDQGHYYNRDPSYTEWHTHASQGQYCAGECLCPGMQCTCGNRRYY
ncbi:hypothetical protein BDP27DRAFT_1330045 [Rhodocollybia butyracea]|uniref:Zn(2)-C6 fungal-type domain-containing protein n=1 Tax=Rhodocollybia butyracea TaxID=206335 RepID=A0A9P5U4H7_9AGAR|nr:hypothetical protein BDP27DRAFT_1330045 [Rhodocollybia butyracea]